MDLAIWNSESVCVCVIVSNLMLNLYGFAYAAPGARQVLASGAFFDFLLAPGGLGDCL